MPLRKVRYRREPLIEVNMTNLIDITMVLLIVFILVSNFVQTGLNINLPKVHYVQTIGKEKIIIGLSAGGEMTLNSQAVTKDELITGLQDLKTQYPDEAVFIHSDGSAVVQDLTNLFSIATQAGFTSVNVAAIEEPRS